MPKINYKIGELLKLTPKTQRVKRSFYCRLLDIRKGISDGGKSVTYYKIYVIKDCIPVYGEDWTQSEKEINIDGWTENWNIEVIDSREMVLVCLEQ